MRDRRPNIKALVKRGKVDALVAAAAYREPAPNQSGGVSDAGVPVRAEAILALGALVPVRGRHAILAGLHDPADPVRCAAVRALHSRRDADTLVRSLEWLPAEGRSRALVLKTVLDLRQLASPVLLAEALVHRQDEEMFADDEVALVLALLGQERTDTMNEVVDLLVGALADEQGIVVDRATELLVRLAPASNEAVLAQLRTGPASAEAAYVLGRIGDPLAVDALVDGLGHGRGSVRAESAAALAELRDPASVKALIQATHDAEHYVRREAANALAQIGTAAVIAGMTELLEPMIHEAVRTALANTKTELDSTFTPARAPKRASRAAKARPNGKAPPSRAKQPQNGKPASTESAKPDQATEVHSNGKPAPPRKRRSGRKQVKGAPADGPTSGPTDGPAPSAPPTGSAKAAPVMKAEPSSPTGPSAQTAKPATAPRPDVLPDGEAEPAPPAAAPKKRSRRKAASNQASKPAATRDARGSSKPAKTPATRFADAPSTPSPDSTPSPGSTPGPDAGSGARSEAGADSAPASTPPD